MQNETSEQDLHPDLFPNFFDRYPQDLFPTEPDNSQSIDEEPLYVNAKQYFRILKRRVARTRLEELHRLSRQRKPYLHESRHKHAMRRPRGPGGRFLTAEEIAAQKRDGPSTVHIDDDHLQLSPDLDPEPSPPPGPSFMQPMVNIDYHIPLSQPISNSTPPPPPTQTPPIYPQQQLPPQQHRHNPQSHHQLSKPINSVPIPMSSPYPPPLQMHHVPHPHAHARHHHSNFSYQMYSDPIPQTPSLDMQRPAAEEMIHFGTSASSSS